jgi:hypothetical protein
MNAILEKFGLTANVVLVTIMFLAYFAGSMAVAHVAILVFAALSATMMIQQRMEA